VKDAISSTVIIQIILIFLVIINSYLAFSVNYTKAFRIKNNIVSIIEENEGLTDIAKVRVEELMLGAGYSIARDYIDRCGTGSLAGYIPIYNNAGGYCVKVNLADNTGTYGDGAYVGAYYSVVTFISIDVPILNKVFPVFADVFSIKGETKTIYSANFDMNDFE